LTSASLITN